MVNGLFGMGRPLNHLSVRRERPFDKQREKRPYSDGMDGLLLGPRVALANGSTGR